MTNEEREKLELEFDELEKKLSSLALDDPERSRVAGQAYVALCQLEEAERCQNTKYEELSRLKRA